VHNQMRQLGCEPGIITYNFLIETRCGKGQGNLDAAMKLLAKMVAKGCVPDSHMFNPHVEAGTCAWQHSAAHKLYENYSLNYLLQDIFKLLIRFSVTIC
jgi:pentatricopeptide repeat protein